MKKTTTIIASLLFAIGLSAQIVPGQNHNNLLKAKNDKITMSGDEALSHLMVNPNPHTSVVLNSNSKSSTISEEIIGATTYDLQSNAAVQNRIIVHDNGNISAGWTMSQEYNTTFSDRGTGYNFFDGTSWGAQPTNRLEASRGGWPSIIALGNGSECAITHNTDNSYINNTSRTYVGTGLWGENPITSSYMIWNRSAAGGVDGNTIHMIGVTASTNFQGTPFNGLDGALVYYRSQDGGTTWDITDMQLPGMDTSMYTAMGGDIYAIAAQGTTVVVAYFDDWGDSYIVKSTDNGDTWTKTIFLDFPVEKYTMDDGLDLDGDLVMDQVYSTDNYGALVLDDDGNAHVFYGIMMYLDDDLADASSSWFPGINGIAYWNESFGPDITPPTMHPGDSSLWYSDMMNDHWIVAAPDRNGDGIVSGIDSTGTYALYYSSRASMPNAGFDANGNIWMSFSGYTENIDNGTQVFRHLYLTKSEDGGINWAVPVDVTPHDMWNGLQECVFGSMNPIINDKIQIIYQADFEPGLAVRGDEDLVDINNIIYLEIDPIGVFDGMTWNCNNNADGCYDPGDGNGLYTSLVDCQNACIIPTTIIELEDLDIEKDTRIFDLLGREWKTDFNDLPKGIYIINKKKVLKTR
ncbi:glycoside hydrolase [Flavobacteriales bacterium]|nr:glycoside hydrolase [Flavobacteriales bacterium]